MMILISGCEKVLAFNTLMRLNGWRVSFNARGYAFCSLEINWACLGAKMQSQFKTMLTPPLNGGQSAISNQGAIRHKCRSGTPRHGFVRDLHVKMLKFRK